MCIYMYMYVYMYKPLQQWSKQLLRLFGPELIRINQSIY